jgi:hypothetical protein
MPKSPQLKAWRDVLPIHPAADLFPSMSESELRELGEDIKKNGMTSPIVLGHWDKYDRKFSLWDGRNRLDALEAVGLLACSPPTDGLWPEFFILTAPTQQSVPVKVLRECDGHDPYGYVLSANIHRRHLTVEQKRDLIEKLLKARPQSSDRAIAKQTKVDHKTVGKARAELEGRGEIPHVEARTDSKGRKQPSTKPKTSAKPAAPRKPDVIIELDRSDYSEVPATSAKPTTPAKPDPIGSPPVRHSEAPATSVPPESRRGSVSARDITLEGFSAHSMELVRLTRNKSARRFAKTSTPDEGIRQLAKLFSDLINIRNEEVVDRICGSAEVSTEQRKAEHAALDEAAS